jgi:TfoX/Sxy family transcriptional regulator of competence genes
MASDLEFVKFVADQIDPSLDIRYRKMFGEYGIWSNDKIVALICDNQVYIKPTEAGRAFIGNVVEAPPYPGAKNSFLIGDQIEDSEWLSELIRISEAELPKPKPRKKKKTRK